MRMQVDGQVELCLEAANQAFGSVGTQQTGHILNADGISAHLCQLLAKLDEVLILMIGADGVDDAALHMCACFLGSTHSAFQVARIVERVEDTDDRNTVRYRAVDKLADYVVSVMIIAEDILAAQQHLNRGFAQMLFECAQALPRVFIQEAQAGVKGGATPGFKSIITSVIKSFKCGQHIANTHSGRSKRLVTVAQNSFYYLYIVFIHVILLYKHIKSISK